MENDNQLTAQLIGHRLRLARKSKGLRQDQLAKMVGFNDRQTISAIEKNVRNVSAEELVKMCAALEVNPEFVLGTKRSIKEFDLLKKLQWEIKNMNNFLNEITQESDSTRRILMMEEYKRDILRVLYRMQNAIRDW